VVAVLEGQPLGKGTVAERQAGDKNLEHGAATKQLNTSETTTVPKNTVCHYK
jgi:hypothetical protein